MSVVIDVRLRSTWVPRVGYRYDVILGDETIVSRSTDPEYDAARALLALGHRGRFRTIDFVTGKPRMIFDIKKAARLRTVERDAGGITVGRYQPMTSEERMRARSHGTDQGRGARDDKAFESGLPFQRDGGERRVRRRAKADLGLEDA